MCSTLRAKLLTALEAVLGFASFGQLRQVLVAPAPAASAGCFAEDRRGGKSLPGEICERVAFPLACGDERGGLVVAARRAGGGDGGVQCIIVAVTAVERSLEAAGGGGGDVGG